MTFVGGGRSRTAISAPQHSTPAARGTAKLLCDDAAAMVPVDEVRCVSQVQSFALNDAGHHQPLGGVPKRAFDVALAAVMLILLAPIMLMATTLIRVIMGSPTIFAQRRVGFNGEVFVCYKFRTMALCAEELLQRDLATDAEAAAEWRVTRKLRDDPRVNCLASILRETSLDELPQLFNILRGDMSLVGPRPIVPDELIYYGRHAHAYCKGRPGSTGMWQTTGRNQASYAARAAQDRYYARRWSLWLDVVLLIKTIPAVLNFDQTG